MLAPLLLSLAPLQASVTPAEFSVRVRTLEVSRSGLEWVQVGPTTPAVEVDLASGAPRSVAPRVVPLGSYDFVRVSISTVMSYRSADPCGGSQDVVREVDWSGDLVIDPDGDRIWQLCFATFDAGGRADGTGALEAPLQLEQPVVVEAGKDAALRLVLGITGIVVCDQGIVTVQRPTPGLSLASANDTQELANQTWLVVGTRLNHLGQAPVQSTFQGELVFHPSGRWSASGLELRELELESGLWTECPGEWEGWWSATEDGDVWLSQTGSEVSLRGWVDRDRRVMALASTGAGEEATILWAVRRGAVASDQPFESPVRLILHDQGLVPVSETPLVSDLVSWRLFARISGTWGYTTVTETAWLNTLNISGWIGGTPPGSPALSSEWTPLHQGLSYTLEGPRLTLTALDQTAEYSGWLASDGRVGVYARAGTVPDRLGLGLTLQTTSGFQNSTVQGRSFEGTFVEDAVVGADLRHVTGTLGLEFVNGVGCALTTTRTGLGWVETESTPGTYECWDEGRIVLRLADGRRYDGQIGSARQTIILTSSEEDGLGPEDRLIGLLISR